MKTNNLIEKGKKNILSTYAQLPVVMDHGEGVYVYDVDGNQYLDFVAGIAVNCLGYNNAKLVGAVSNQMKKLVHCSNLYWNTPNIEVAEILVRHSGLSQAFFCNSGAESIEAALKLARKYGKKKSKDCYKIITMDHSFHGRTYGAITATGQAKYQKDLEPLLPGIEYCSYNDFQALQEKVDDYTCAIIIEPIQGEGGIRPVDTSYLKKVRALCDEKDIVLIFDEVQCGIGRTGTLFAFQSYGVKPDIVTLAKGLGGGIPIGAIIASEKVSSAFQPGDHASTFGGNPIASAASKTVLTELLGGGVLNNVKLQGKYLTEKLLSLKNTYDCIIDQRGFGLMQGIELDVEVRPIIEKCMENGLLLAAAGAKVIRFVPPLIVTKTHIDEAIGVLDAALSEVDA